MLTFANFKQIIPQQILTRGRDYMRKGQIADLSFDDEGVWEAQVEGTETYEVRVEQSTGGELHTSCTCPYDMGAYCKHVAAVLYAIEENFPEQITNRPRKAGKPRKTRQDKLRALLEKTPHPQLISTLMMMAEENRELLNNLLMRLEMGAPDATDFQRVIKGILRAAKAEYGMIDYLGAKRAGRKILSLLNEANGWIANGDNEKALILYETVIEEVTPVISSADDSDGALSSSVETAIEAIEEAAPLLDKPDQERAFDYCLLPQTHPAFYDFGWDWGLLSAAGKLVNTPERRTRFMAALDVKGATTSDSHDYLHTYRQEQIALLKLDVIDRMDGQEAARAFLLQNVRFDAIRLALIERDLDEGLLEEAQRLIHEGIQANSSNRLTGLADQYRALEARLLQSKGDKRGLIDTLAVLWISRGYSVDFDQLHALVPANEWPTVVDRLLRDLEQRPEQRAWLLAREERYQQLLSVVKSFHHPQWLLEQYRHLLESHLPNEMTALYEDWVEKIMVRASGRSDYAKVAEYLQRMKQLGKGEQAQTMAARFRAQYPNRRALLDEIKNI